MAVRNIAEIIALLLTASIFSASCSASPVLIDTHASEPTLDFEGETFVNLDLPILGNAPELSNDIWLNSDMPLRLADLKGKVVLLDFWTFG